MQQILANIYRKVTGNDGIMKDTEDPRNFVHLGFNSQPKLVLFPDNILEKYLLDNQQQNKHGEKMNCVTNSGGNLLQSILNRMIELEKLGEVTEAMKNILAVMRYFKIIKNGRANIGKRFNSKMSGTSWRGNNYTRVWKSFANDGILAEDEWPEEGKWNEYYKEIPQELKDKAKKILEFVEIKYERVDERNYADSYNYSAVQTAINSPGRKEGNIIFPRGGSNHAVAAYRDMITSRLFKDSYKPFNKEYTLAHKYGRGVIGHFKSIKKFNPFNQQEINKWRIGRKKEYVLRVEKHGELWRLLPNGMEYVEQVGLGDFAKELVRNGSLDGISEANFDRFHI